MAKEYKIEVDYTQLTEAMEELTKAIEEFNRAWKSLPLPVRIAHRLKFFVQDAIDLREVYMLKLYNAFKIEMRKK